MIQISNLDDLFSHDLNAEIAFRTIIEIYGNNHDLSSTDNKTIHDTVARTPGTTGYIIVLDFSRQKLL